MSYDLYFWPSGAARNPQRLSERLADGRSGSLKPDGRVPAFRAELLRRWPDLIDVIEPWHTDLGRRQPTGQTNLADRFVVLTLPYRWPATDVLPTLAGVYGLDCYDPQTGHVTPPRPGAEAWLITWERTVEGWIAEIHLVRLFRQISSYIGYAYDDLDADALVGALDDTDDESPDGWFEYPLEGTLPLVVQVAQPPGSAIVRVRVKGTMDLALTARVETVIEMLQ